MTFGNGKATFIAALFGLIFIATSTQYGDSISQFLDSKSEDEIYLDAAKMAQADDVFNIDMNTFSLDSDENDQTLTMINGRQYAVEQFSSLSDVSVIGRAKEAYLFTQPFSAHGSSERDVYALCFRSKNDTVCTLARQTSGS